MKSFNRIRCLNNVVEEIINKNKLKDVIVADIATDHGYLAELLSRNDNVSKVIATDISQKCLDKTNDLKNKFNLDKIETRLGDGLEPIEIADMVVIAGVGGYEIIKILNTQNKKNNNENKCNIFVLQPSKNAVDLRLFLIEKNIKILLDFLVFSGGKFYPIIVANLLENNDTEANLFNVYFGRENDVNNEVFIRFLNCQMNKLKFLENLSCDEINNSNELKTKFDIYDLVKNLLNKSKGE